MNENQKTYSYYVHKMIFGKNIVFAGMTQALNPEFAESKALIAFHENRVIASFGNLEPDKIVIEEYKGCGGNPVSLMIVDEELS